jgi:Uma2 family endonuclease
MERGHAPDEVVRRAEYDHLIEIGFFQPGDKVELVGGRLLAAEPQGAAHMTAILLAEEALRRVFPTGWSVRVQGPVALDGESEPEPDVAVVRGGPRDYRHDHPARPALVVEVAETSLAFDREVKGGLYARAGLADYWIVNLIDRMLEVYRDPVPAPQTRYGWAHSATMRLGPEASISPLAVPGATVAVADLLP